MSILYTGSMILGIDEAGRGPWAGPLAVGAVVLGGAQIDGLDDSKKLTKKRRESLELEIKQKADAWSIGWVTASELDEIGMSAALQLATRRAVEQIHVPYHEIIIDGTVNFLRDTSKGPYVTTLPKADALVPSVSAASIIAKVGRDRYMAELDTIYPGYGFVKHAGYGVAAHRAVIERIGVCPEHRLSFAPLKKYKLEDNMVVCTDTLPRPQTTRATGDASETVAADYLRLRGHHVLARNWKTKWCEIDIVSEYQGTVYFTEVKHRKDDTAGNGLAAITPKKQRQMAFAATLYAAMHHVTDHDLRLAAIATTGVPPEVTDYLDIA